MATTETLEGISLTVSDVSGQKVFRVPKAPPEATVGELGAPFALSQPAISKHIKVLQAAGLISQSRAAQTRPCRLERAGLQDLDGFMQRFRAVTEVQLDQMDSYLSQIQSHGETG